MPATLAAKPARTISRRRSRANPVVETPIGRLSVPLPASGEATSVGITNWQSYLGLDRALEDRGYRVRFFNGIIEIMSISFHHDSISRTIGHLIAAFCDFAGLDWQAWGSTTQRKKGIAGSEPDESFTFGSAHKDKPDLVVEIGLTSGGIDKVELWKALGAKEIWIWQHGGLHGFARASESKNFHPIAESTLLKGLKLSLIQEFAGMQPSSKAVREFRAKLEKVRKA